MCKSEGETQEKSIGYYIIQFLIVVGTLIGQIILLCQIPLQLNNNYAILSYLLSNLCIESGYLLDLTVQLDTTIKSKSKTKKWILKSVFWFEIGFVIFDIANLFIKTSNSNENINLPVNLTVPIISTIGIALYAMLILVKLIFVVKDEKK